MSTDPVALAPSPAFALVIAVAAGITATSCDVSPSTPDPAGTRWVATHIDDIALRSAAGPNPSRANADGPSASHRPTTLEFGAAGNLGGFSGCNDYGAAYHVSRGRIVIEGGVSAHMVGCEGEAAASEHALFRALDGPYRLGARELDLGGSGRPTIRFRRAN